MGWESISLADIPQETKGAFTPVPDGTYTLQLMGASENQYRPGGLNITVAVADGTEHAGRRIFVDLPDAEQMPWAKAVLARMFEALGTEIPTYNFNAIDELNKLANNGHSRFSASVYTEHYKAKDGVTDKSRNKINFRSIAPAA